MPLSVPTNTPGLTSVDYARYTTAQTDKVTQALNQEFQTGGVSDYLADNTPQLKKFLSTTNKLAQNTVLTSNLRDINTKAKAQIQGLQLLQNISSEFGRRLINVRNASNPMKDDTFPEWCQSQLTAIAREFNRTMSNGEYAFASQTSTTAPIDPSQLGALPSNAIQNFSYLQGTFGQVDNGTIVQPFKVDAKSTGIEALIRALRIAQSGDVNDENHACWVASQNLLNNTANPNLGMDLQRAGEISRDAQQKIDDLNQENSILSQDAKDAGYRAQSEVMQELYQSKTMKRVQESVYILVQQELQSLLDRLDRNDL